MILENEPLVTVGMPAYNHEKYIKEAILSTIEQTYKNIEFIIINDGSTDNTDKIIKELENDCKNRFVNFIYINQDNKGISYTLNKILNLAKGEYITFISSDDTQVKNKIEEGVKFFLQNPEYDFCYSGYNDIDDNSNIIKTTIPESSFELDFEETLFRVKYFSYFTYMAKVEVLKQIGGYIDKIKIEDIELALRVSFNNKKAIYLNKALYNHRLHPNNTVKKLQYMKDGMFEILDLYKKHPKYDEAIKFWTEEYKKRNYHEFINSAYSKISKYNSPSLKIIIYGHGAFGKIIESLIQDSNYCFVDQSSNKDLGEFEKGEVYSKKTLSLIDFDYIFISVLWLDVNIKYELINTYKIDSEKIIMFESFELV